MKIFRLTMVVAAFLFAAHFVRAEISDDDMKKMKDTWSLVAAAGDMPPDAMNGTTMVIDQGRLSITSGQHTENATFTLDASKSPAWIEITQIPDPKAVNRPVETVHGIYAWDGKNLKMRWTSRGGARPAAFGGQPGENEMELTFSRGNGGGEVRAATQPAATQP